jgi:glutaredoxin 3
MIKIYTKTTCPYCDQAKQLLEAFGFEYEVVNIEQDTDARTWLLDQGHKSVPQLYINDKLLEGGFNGLQSVGKTGVQALLEG